jgi:hypothetical protein
VSGTGTRIDRAAPRSTPAIALAIRYGTEQGLLSRPLTLDEVWAGLPPGCEE